ncbi:alanine--tRNA ligase [Candidatus Gracilibacteria bacterium]|nr:alanine--tRNA ligase [Candidatus Gracilibacteria bacterium]
MKHTTDNLRTAWFEFWRAREHAIIPSAGVLPDNDPTALFHNSGMHPLVPFLMGESHPEGVRIANAQKCIRTGDIDEVGDASHLTFFEMLGNWSLGDYFKDDQIRWSFEFLTQVLKLPVKNLAVSVFAGDDDAPRDTEAAEVWKSCDIADERIAYLGKKHNWWAKGDIGPCGPDTEMFFWVGEDPAPANFQDTHDDPRWVEIWNDVFMQFHRDAQGKLHPLPQKNIDTGMGLERTVVALNKMSSVYETDAFASLLQKLSELSDKPEIANNPAANTETARSARIIADHIRTATIILADSVAPSNMDQGYILRRLIRRAIRHGRKINMPEQFCNILAKTVIDQLSPTYPELKWNESFVLEELEREEAQFQKTLEKGEREFQKMIEPLSCPPTPSCHPERSEGSSPSCHFKSRSSCHPEPTKPAHRGGAGRLDSGSQISGADAFHLYETYGFPLEITQELAAEKGLTVDEKEFQRAFEAHQALSRAGSEQKFKGGLGDQSETTVKLHTATHLLHAALRKVLGLHVEQRGSNITPERLRFDFSHPEKMTPEQIAEVEQLVNEAIQADAPIHCEESTVDAAKEAGAIGLFEHKYGDKVKVYSMGEFSKEICGGPHVQSTGELGSFKILKEEASSRGVRRIKATVS